MVYFPDEVWINSRSATVYIDGSSAVSGRDREFAGGQQYIRADLVPQWQPFDTAPTNVQILVRRSDHVEERSGDICTAIVYNVERDIKFFTHWMPIPKVPE